MTVYFKHGHKQNVPHQGIPGMQLGYLECLQKLGEAASNW
jgi:hypothetical protein